MESFKYQTDNFGTHTLGGSYIIIDKISQRIVAFRPDLKSAIKACQVCQKVWEEKEKELKNVQSN
jgi:hypothetical protein